MESEVDERVRSRPLYSPIGIQEKAHFHLFIAEVNDECDLPSLFELCGSQSKKWLVLLAADVDAMKKATVTTPPMIELNDTLSSLPLSSHLYVAGGEPFMWDVYQIAITAGLLAEQISLMPPKSSARRVFCTHCYTVMNNIHYTPYTCEGCQRPLLVRDHFSRLHGAYVGLNINAEDVNDIPPTEALT
jgi:hypothetical protein